MRAENARLQACLKELTAERDAWKGRVCRQGQPREQGDNPVEMSAVRERLLTILKRLDQIERHLEALEGQ